MVGQLSFIQQPLLYFHSTKFLELLRLISPHSCSPASSYCQIAWERFGFYNQMSAATKIYTAFLFLPAAGFFLQNSLINQQASFLLMTGLLMLAYFSHTLTFQRQWLNVLRKGLGCLSSAVLILLVSAEVSEIITVVYSIEFGEEISFLLKMVLMLSNMEGNLDLCASNQPHAKHPHHDTQTTPHVV